MLLKNTDNKTTIQDILLSVMEVAFVTANGIGFRTELQLLLCIIAGVLHSAEKSILAIPSTGSKIASP